MSCLRTGKAMGLLIALAGLGVARAQADSPEIKSLKVGFDGAYKQAFWTPIDVTIHGGSAPTNAIVLVDVADEDGVATRVSTPSNRPVALPPGRDTHVKLFVKPGSTTPEFKVRLLTDAGEDIRRSLDAMNAKSFTEALASVRPLVLTVGEPAGIEEPSEGSNLPEAERLKIARVMQVDSLPTRWYGYDGVNAVVLITSNPDMYRQLTPDSADSPRCCNGWSGAES